MFGPPKKQVKIIHNSQNSRDFPVLSRQASTTRHTHGRDVNDAVTGTTTTQAARRGIQSMRVSCGKVTTKCQESGTRTVKACPRGHDDMGSHASQTSVSLNSQGLESQPYVMGGKVRNSQTLMNTPRRMGTPVVASRTRLDGPRTRLKASRCHLPLHSRHVPHVPPCRLRHRRASRRRRRCRDGVCVVLRTLVLS